MRIDFECSGGFANLQLIYHTDTDKLSTDQADELMQLVDSSGVRQLNQHDVVSRPIGVPDAISYRLSVSEGGGKKVLAFNDVTAPAAFHPLLSYLRKQALEQRRKGL